LIGFEEINVTSKFIEISLKHLVPICMIPLLPAIVVFNRQANNQIAKYKTAMVDSHAFHMQDGLTNCPGDASAAKTFVVDGECK